MPGQLLREHRLLASGRRAEVAVVVVGAPLALADLDLDASASPRDGDVGVRLLPRLLVGLDLAGYQFLGHHALRSPPSRGVSGTPRVPGIHRVPLIGSAILGRAQILDQTTLVRG